MFGSTVRSLIGPSSPGGPPGSECYGLPWSASHGRQKLPPGIRRSSQTQRQAGAGGCSDSADLGDFGVGRLDLQGYAAWKSRAKPRFHLSALGPQVNPRSWGPGALGPWGPYFSRSCEISCSAKAFDSTWDTFEATRVGSESVFVQMGSPPLLLSPASLLSLHGARAADFMEPTAVNNSSKPKAAVHGFFSLTTARCA